MQLTTCAICEGHHSMMREHCPYCGARRAFIATHSYEPYRVVITMRNAERLSVELVRAFSTTFCSDEQRAIQDRGEYAD